MFTFSLPRDSEKNTSQHSSFGKFFSTETCLKLVMLADMSVRFLQDLKKLREKFLGCFLKAVSRILAAKSAIYVV